MVLNRYLLDRLCSCLFLCGSDHALEEAFLFLRSVSDLEVKSVKKKYKDKKFAAGCSREVIERGAEMLGWDLDTLIEQTILAMRASIHVE